MKTKPTSSRSPKFERDSIDRLARIEEKADAASAAAKLALAEHVRHDDERFDGLEKKVERSRSWLVDWLRPIVTGGGSGALVFALTRCH